MVIGPQEQMHPVVSTTARKLKELSNEFPEDSSPIHYASSSSPSRTLPGQRQTDVPSSSSGLFMRSSGSLPGSSSMNRSRRGDIHSDMTRDTSNRRRLFMDESG